MVKLRNEIPMSSGIMLSNRRMMYLYTPTHFPLQRDLSGKDGMGEESFAHPVT